MKNPVFDRRKFLKFSVLASTAVAFSGISPSVSQEKKATKAKIVILGAGAAGLTAASYLTARLEGAEIIILDSRKLHYYQPGFTLIAGGIQGENYATSKTADYMPAGVQWVEEEVAEVDPEANKVISQSGKIFPYDYLIVATGLHLDYGAIAGMDVERIGKDGLGSVYRSPEAAFATWKAMSQFADQGGIGVFCRPATEMKCAGAPLKYTFITDDHLRRRNTRGRAEIHYFAHNKTFFSVPIVSEKVRMLFENRGVNTRYDHVLKEIDIGKKKATFATPNGDVQQPYDFINVIPPMRVHSFLFDSPLPWKDGPWVKEGWLEVDKATLRHKRFPNVFALGDVAGVPKGKTAASVKWQVPVVVEHLVAEVSGQKSTAVYKGYTSCPLITKLGRAMLVEFDYNNNLVPSFPGVIAPLEELWVSWVMKTMALKPTYLAMLRGRA